MKKLCTPGALADARSTHAHVRQAGDRLVIPDGILFF